MQYFQTGDNNPERRRVYLHLVDASDGITPETGEAGTKCKISFNGRAAVDSVSAIAAVDGTNQPGTYYLELSVSELVHPGMLVVRYKSSNTAEFVQICQVMTFDPYTYTGAGHGGGSDVSYSTIRRIIKEELTTLPAPQATANVDMIPFSEGLQALLNEIREIRIPKPEKVNLQPVFDAVSGVLAAVRAIERTEAPDLSGIENALSALSKKLDAVQSKEIDIEPLLKALEAKRLSHPESAVFGLVPLARPDAPKSDVIKEYLNL